MRDAAAVADDVKPVVAGHEVAVHLDLHVVELHLHAVEQRVVVGSAGGDFIQRVNHLNDAVQNALGQHEAQVARGGVQRRHGERLLDALLGAALAADEVGHLQNDLLDIRVVKEKHGRAQPIGQRNHRLRQLTEIRRFHHQARDALIHQRLKGMCHELRVAARVSQRGYDQIAAVKIRKLHAGGVVFKQNGRRHGALQSVPTGDQAQMLNILKPKQLFNVNQARSPPALFCG